MNACSARDEKPAARSRTAGTVSQSKTSNLNNYSGNHEATHGLMGSIPSAWVPYVQLARLIPPAGLFLIYFPHAFGVLHGALRISADPLDVIKAAVVTFAGSFFLSNAIHIWNDLIDAPLDAQVTRTRNRPIPRGAVSPLAAFLYTATQAIGAAMFLPLVRIDSLQAFVYALPSIFGWTYYPWAKRHTHFPQLVLGFCLAWGIIVGELAVGVTSFWPDGQSSNAAERTLKAFGWEFNFGTVCLFAASVIWTMIYDTVYAHQDLEDDIAAGIKSTAVLFGRAGTKKFLWLLLLSLSLLLLRCGQSTGFGPAFYLLSVGGATVSLGAMVYCVQLDDDESCWWWFGKGFWFAGGAIVSGLFAEYIWQIM